MDKVPYKKQESTRKVIAGTGKVPGQYQTSNRNRKGKLKESNRKLLREYQENTFEF